MEENKITENILGYDESLLSVRADDGSNLLEAMENTIKVSTPVNQPSTNPNGSNQYQADPRQKLCWQFYNDFKGETFSNAYQSAMKAGYTEGYAAQITTQDWFLEKVRRGGMLTKAEKVLDKTLTYEPVDEKGEIKVDLVRVQVDVAKHITKTLGKDEGYSERQEHTGKDGKDLNDPTVLTVEEQIALKSLLKK